MSDSSDDMEFMSGFVDEDDELDFDELQARLIKLEKENIELQKVLKKLHFRICELESQQS